MPENCPVIIRNKLPRPAIEGGDRPAVCRSRGGHRLVGLVVKASASRAVCLLVGCLTSQQQASVSQGRICSDNFTCCHPGIEVPDPTFHLTQSQYTDIGPASPSPDPITPGAWKGSHWSANFKVTGVTRPRKNPVASGIRTRDLPLSRRDALTTRPTRRSPERKIRCSNPACAGLLTGPESYQ